MAEKHQVAASDRPSEQASNSKVLAFRARIRNPDAIIEPRDVIRTAEPLSKILHTRLKACGDAPTAKAIADCLIAAIAGKERKERTAAIQLIGKASEVLSGNLLNAGLDPESMETVFGTLCDVLGNDEPDSRRAAIEVIAKWGPKPTARIVRILTNLAASERDKDNILLILQTLQAYGPDLAALAGPKLLALVEHADDGIATAVCQVLEEAGETNGTTLDTLIRNIKNGRSLAVRVAAMRAIVAINPTTEQLVECVDRHGVREAAVELLAEIGARGRELRQGLVELQREGGKTARKAGVESDKKAIATTSTVPWPQAEGWDFSPGKAAYNGKQFPIVGKAAELLKHFVAKPKGYAVELKELRLEFWNDYPINDETIIGHISNLNKLIRKKLGLADSEKPIMSRGKSTKAYELKLR